MAYFYFIFVVFVKKRNERKMPLTHSHSHPQIHSADEFDMMLKLQVPFRLDMTKLDGGLFYRLDLRCPTRKPIRDFLLDNERTLASSKILSEAFRLVRKFLKTYRGEITP